MCTVVDLVNSVDLSFWIDWLMNTDLYVEVC